MDTLDMENVGRSEYRVQSLGQAHAAVLIEDARMLDGRVSGRLVPVDIHGAGAGFLAKDAFDFALDGEHSALGQSGELRIWRLTKEEAVVLVRRFIVPHPVRIFGRFKKRLRSHLLAMASRDSKRQQKRG